LFIIGLTATILLEPNRGTISGALLAIVAVFVLLLFQVSGPTLFSWAYGLVVFEWCRWIPAYMVGAALGSLIYFRRRPR
jgi:hypothetical protein